MGSLAEPMKLMGNSGLPKYLRIKAVLTEHLRGMVEDEPLPSMAELQGQFGVALGTMDRALKELRRDGLIDVRHGSGIYATGRSQTMRIGICFGHDVLEPESGVYPRLLLRGLGHAEAADRALQCRHYFAAGSGERWTNKFDLLCQDASAGLVDGVICIGVYFDWMANLPIPSVGLLSIPNVTSRVVLDYQDLVRQGLHELANRGCRRIGFAGGHRQVLPAPDSSVRAVARDHEQARQFFLTEVAALGLTTHEQWVQGPKNADATGISPTESEGSNMGHAIFGDTDLRPDGVISTDDHRTLGLCEALADRGLTVGEDVQVATLANLGSPTLNGLDVVRISFDPDVVAGALMESVTGLISGREQVPALRYVKGTLMTEGE